MKNVLITGGLGHLGSHLSENLDGYNITIMDDMLTQRYCSLFNRKKGVKFVEGDFCDLSITDLNKFDVIIHFAARTDATSSITDSDTTWDINVIKTKKLIDKISESKVKLFIFPSSTSVYGVATDEVFEDVNEHVNPQSPYADSKVEVEKYLTNSNINYVILRFGTIFGCSKGMRFHTAINKFCYQSALGKPLTVWRENYEQYRPYLGLGDMTQSVKLVLNNESSWNNIFNVLTDNFSLENIVSRIQEEKHTNINFVDTPLLNQYTYFVNFDKIKKLGFKPSDDLSVDIKKTIKLLSNE